VCSAIAAKKYPGLGKWVIDQRYAKKLRDEGKKKSDMTDEREAALNAIGFTWKTNKKNPPIVAWRTRYESLLEYMKEHGDCNVPLNYPADPALGRWVVMQRTQKRYMDEGNKSYMTPERVKLLEDIGFNWQQRAAVWEVRLSELQEYKAEHGDCNVPITWAQNPALGE